MDTTIDVKSFAPNGKHNGYNGKANMISRKIKYESELNGDFKETIAELAHGEKLYGCIQCGTCSAACPVSHYMDYTPRKIIQMVREGFRDDVLKSSTVWLCASCYSCTVECPKGIKITDVMYALKREAISAGYTPKRFPTPVLAESFFSQVLDNGRNSEGPLLMKMYMKTNPFNAFKNMMLGFRLWKTGRLTLKTEHTKDRKSLKKLLGSIDKQKEALVK
jgi:heterodisulfide reductase subunit C